MTPRWKRSDRMGQWMASLMIGLAIFNVYVGWISLNWFSLLNFLAAVFMIYLARLHLILGVRRRETKLFDEIREHWYEN